MHSHAAGMDAGLRVLSYLLAGVALYGGAGWLADHLLGTGFWLPIGIVLRCGGRLIHDHPAVRPGRAVDPERRKATTGEVTR